jgi:glycosyltransferase involved in cell wall biosynthesis
VPHSIRRSAAVFTVSDFSRQEICNRYSIDSGKVHTIPNGVDLQRFFPGTSGLNVVDEFGLKSGSYFLTVGRLEPRKNHATLLRGWAALAEPRPRLVIVGQRHFQYSEVFDLIRTLRLQKDVLILEQVSDPQLPALYRHAKGFIYSSWAEGFGMPLIEAMASGVPVISSTNTALAEVCADGAIMVDPVSPSDIAAAVIALDSNPAVREDMIRRGFVRARQFTWEASATTVRTVYLNHFGISDES